VWSKSKCGHHAHDFPRASTCVGVCCSTSMCVHVYCSVRRIPLQLNVDEFFQICLRMYVGVTYIHLSSGASLRAPRGLAQCFAKRSRVLWRCLRNISGIHWIYMYIWNICMFNGIYMYTCIYIYTYVHIYIYVYTHTYIYTYTRMHLQVPVQERREAARNEMFENPKDKCTPSDISFF